MGNIAISVENLGKRYRIGLAEKRPDNFREAVSSFVKAPFRYLQTRLREPSPDEIIWALKDVSFEAKHGEVIGIIGRNGAGKSTLLKILSRITEPTEGLAKVYGRIGSLLEVGTGFHPELTGRENIYLNGAILGMWRAEIARRFDEIVDFSGVEKFLDTPVKRYSSGMYVRLAFAVAAHLEPEILLVDEVLAVGDAEFQKKCLGKMGDIAKEGRTVLFVSHNMIAVQRLCSRSLLLNQGTLALDGQTYYVVQKYLSNRMQNGTCEKFSLETLPRHNGFGQLIRFTTGIIFNSKNQATTHLLFGESFSIYLEARPEVDLQGLSVIIGIDSFIEYRITTIASEDKKLFFSVSPDSSLRVHVSPEHLLLKPGVYLLTLGIRSGGQGLEHLPHVIHFTVSEATDKEVQPDSGTWGLVHTTARWKQVDSNSEMFMT